MSILKTIKGFVMTFIEVIQNTRKLQAEELKKRYFQR
jgi:hypothetical protein